MMTAGLLPRTKNGHNVLEAVVPILQLVTALALLCLSQMALLQPPSTSMCVYNRFTDTFPA